MLIRFFSFFLFSHGIKETAINQIKDFYKKDIVIDESKFSITKNIKREIQNKAKQAFFRDKVYYGTIQNGNNTCKIENRNFQWIFAFFYLILMDFSDFGNFIAFSYFIFLFS